MPEDVLRHLDDLAQGTDEVQLGHLRLRRVRPRSGARCPSRRQGHPPPVLRAPDGDDTSRSPQPSGAPLGVGGDPFESTTVG